MCPARALKRGSLNSTLPCGRYTACLTERGLCTFYPPFYLKWILYRDFGLHSKSKGTVLQVLRRKLAQLNPHQREDVTACLTQLNPATWKMYRLPD
jgi:hypothetical protein